MSLCTRDLTTIGKGDNMRILLLTILALVVVSTGANATNVYVDFVVDPNIEGGGYFEATVDNDEGVPIYYVMIGDTGADVMWTVPSGVYRTWRISESEWTSGGVTWGGLHASATPVNTTAPGNEFATLFPGQTQVLAWYVSTTGSPIDPGMTQGGFRFKYPSSAAAATAGAVAGLPFALFNASGQVQVSGTTGVTVPVEEGTWGGVKALYR